MQSAKEKISNMASSCKEHLDIYKAKVEEQAEKAAAKTKEEKEMAKERRKAKEAKTKMELHEAKANHAANKLYAKQSHLFAGHHQPPMSAGTHQTTPMVGLGTEQHPPRTNMPGATVPTYPFFGKFPNVNNHI